MLNYRFGHHIFWAGFIGFLIGILFSFTVWAGNRVLQTRAQLTEDEAFYSNLATQALSLSLSSPADQAIVTSPTVTISGTTSSEAVILITGGSADLATDSSGAFSISYTLLEGTNELTIEAVDADGRQATEKRTVFYTTEKLE